MADRLIARGMVFCLFDLGLGLLWAAAVYTLAWDPAGPEPFFRRLFQGLFALTFGPALATAGAAEGGGAGMVRSLLSGAGLAWALLGPTLFGLRLPAGFFLGPGTLLAASGLFGPGGRLAPGLTWPLGLAAALLGLGLTRLVLRS